MSIFKLIIAELLYRPIYNILLVFLILFGGSLWRAIICLTIVVRLLLINVTSKSNQMQAGMWNLQNETKAIQDKYKDDPQKQSEEMMKVLKKSGGGPLKWCLMMLVQLPVFLALYFVVRKITAWEIPQERIYSFLRQDGIQYMDPANINTNFLGVDLLATWHWGLSILAAILVYFQTRLTNFAKPKQEQSQKLPTWQAMPDMWKMMWYMSYFMMVMMWFVVYTMQGAIGLYIVMTTLFSVLQYSYQYKALLLAETRAFFSKGKPTIVEKK